jgi:hypothetical protein
MKEISSVDQDRQRRINHVFTIIGPDAIRTARNMTCSGVALRLDG